jgi:hypothetical protein
VAAKEFTVQSMLYQALCFADIAGIFTAECIEITEARKALYGDA